MNIYVYDDGKLHGAEAEKMIKKAALLYSEEKGTDPHIQKSFSDKRDDVPAEALYKILRSKYGKPYFPNLELEFSVSHSGQLWVCAVSEETVGIDIQEIRNVNALRLAKRFFSQEEAAYVELRGTDGFFDIWVRKEAYIKYRGKGFFKENPKSFSVVSGGRLCDSIGYDSDRLYITGVDIGYDIKCALCCKKPVEIGIRKFR